MFVALTMKDEARKTRLVAAVATQLKAHDLPDDGDVAIVGDQRNAKGSTIFFIRIYGLEWHARLGHVSFDSDLKFRMDAFNWWLESRKEDLRPSRANEWVEIRLESQSRNATWLVCRRNEVASRLRIWELTGGLSTVLPVESSKDRQRREDCIEQQIRYEYERNVATGACDPAQYVSIDEVATAQNSTPREVALSIHKWRETNGEAPLFVKIKGRPICQMAGRPIVRAEPSRMVAVPPTKRKRNRQ